MVASIRYYYELCDFGDNLTCPRTFRYEWGQALTNWAKIFGVFWGHVKAQLIKKQLDLKTL